MMRFNFVYVVPKLCQVHSKVQMKIIPCLHQHTTQKSHHQWGQNPHGTMQFLLHTPPRCSKVTHQGLGGAFAVEGPGYPTGVRFADPEGSSQIPCKI